MNRSEVVDLLTYAAACDQRTVGEADVLVWFDMLAPLDFDACLTAARQHYRRSPDVRLKPGHLWQMCATRTDSEAADAGHLTVCTCAGAGTCPVCVHGVICGTCKGVHRADEPCTVLTARTLPRSLESLTKTPPAQDEPETTHRASEDERRRQLDALDVLLRSQRDAPDDAADAAEVPAVEPEHAAP